MSKARFSVFKLFRWKKPPQQGLLTRPESIANNLQKSPSPCEGNALRQETGIFASFCCRTKGWRLARRGSPVLLLISKISIKNNLNSGVAPPLVALLSLLVRKKVSKETHPKPCPAAQGSLRRKDERRQCENSLRSNSSPCWSPLIHSTQAAAHGGKVKGNVKSNVKNKAFNIWWYW